MAGASWVSWKIDVVASEFVHRVRCVSAQTVAKVLPLRTLWLSILDSPRPGRIHLHPRERASVMTDLTSVSLPQFTGVLVEGVRERPLLNWAFFDEWSRLRLHDQSRAIAGRDRRLACRSTSMCSSFTGTILEPWRFQLQLFA